MPPIVMTIPYSSRMRRIDERVFGRPRVRFLPRHFSAARMSTSCAGNVACVLARMLNMEICFYK